MIPIRMVFSRVQKTLKTKNGNSGTRFSFREFLSDTSFLLSKIRNEKELVAFADLIFRREAELSPEEAAILNLKLKEEFPRKRNFLVEELIEKKNAKHFLEITGGLLTTLNDKGEREYNIFAAPKKVLTR